MHYKKLILVLIVIFSLTGIDSTVSDIIPIPKQHLTISDNSFIQSSPIYVPNVKTFASKIGETIENSIENNLVAKVIKCESGWKQDAIGLAGEIGIAQFLPKSWKMFNKLRDTDLDINNAQHQVEMITWAFENGYQCHWSCYKHITGLCK